MGRLLLLSCSETKVKEPRSLPAIERYDGPTFRVVRKFLREAPDHLKDVDIYILSAKYGLIPAAKEIGDYNQRMVPKRAAELQTDTQKGLEEAIANHGPDELFLSLGRDYLRAIDGFEKQLPSDIQVTVSQGTAGKKLTALRDWLYRQQTVPTTRREGIVRQPELPMNMPRSVQIRGQMISLSTEEALSCARQALTMGQGDPERYRSWYALVDDRKVSPKWWVSQLCGLPVNAFVADEARRVLRGLGIKVYQTDG